MFIPLAAILRIYFWNMYQLMSAAVHVLRYVLSSGYQMRALHEFTNVSGS